ncbi:hypothetical protein DPMN_030401 [Dreissena polymorpha]|uniref:LRAT domain-containing protein n=1 Tax=Dreissena polymorpha TaxID=45954 RepID=A0A9D4LY44_DREPO|nr:hypothetical protein DPMN_030401 [Dreissena polymorpha]
MQCECGSRVFTTYTDEDNDEPLGFNCSECSQEWLKEEYVSDAGNTTIIFHGQEYKQKLNKIEDVDGVFQITASRTKLEKDNCCSILRSGDHITFRRPYVIYHHLIVVEADQSNNTLKVIHYTDNNGETQIIESDINIEKELGDLYRIDYSNEITNKNSPKLVMARARSRVGETKYKFLKNNCESFAAYCKTGISECRQVKWFMGKVVEALGITATRIATESTNLVGVLARKVTNDITRFVFNIAGKVTFPGVLEKISMSCNSVGAGIVIAMETGYLVWDLSKMYLKRKNGDMSRRNFIEMAAQRFSEAFGSMGLTIGLGLAGSELGGLVGAVVGSAFPGVGTAVGVFIGSVLGGLLGSIAGRAFGSAVGPFVGKLITTVIKTDDKALKNIKEIEPGDHIVLCRWFLHPRCHAIVVDIDADSTNPKIRVIRNKYEKGVVEEWVAFRDPTYKVTYREYETYHPDLVIERARSKLGQNNYSIVLNNCKDFAKWCKVKQTQTHED